MQGKQKEVRRKFVAVAGKQKEVRRKYVGLQEGKQEEVCRIARES